MPNPKEFCEAMRELVVLSQRNPATAVSAEAYEMKLRILDFFTERDPTPDVMDSLLRERIADPDPMKELSRGICGQILNSWQAGSWHYSPDGRLLLRALYPAETPSGIEEDEP